MRKNSRASGCSCLAARNWSIIETFARFLRWGAGALGMPPPILGASSRGASLEASRPVDC